MKNHKIIQFDNAGYYFFGIVLLVILGFSPSYFVKLPSEAASFNGYTHFHAVIMILWLAMLLVQPFLIRRKQFKTHRLLGKLSYVLVPLALLSAYLLVWYRLRHPNDFPGHLISYIVFMDSVILFICYLLAIYYRKNSGFHARFMIGTTPAIIEPALTRTLSFYFPLPHPAMGILGSFLLIDLIFVILIILERKQKKGRWIFPAILALMLVLQSFMAWGVETQFWKDFVAFAFGLA